MIGLKYILDHTLLYKDLYSAVYMWFKGKRILDLEEATRQLAQEIFALKQNQAIFETNLRSVRGHINKKIGKLDTNEEEASSSSDIDEIVKAFGGSVPVELAEKYKNR